MSSLSYQIEDIPPWHLTCLFGLQQYLVMFGSAVAKPFLIFPYLCLREDDPARGDIIATTFFVCGISTLLQVSCKRSQADRVTYCN